jgi:hypothetical protein
MYPAPLLGHITIKTINYNYDTNLNAEKIHNISYKLLQLSIII